MTFLYVNFSLQDTPGVFYVTACIHKKMSKANFMHS
jgi:hypothetical protein